MRGLLERLIVAKLVKKLPTYYKAVNFITVFRRDGQQTLS
jgi:hypothetical protein